MFKTQTTSLNLVQNFMEATIRLGLMGLVSGFSFVAGATAELPTEADLNFKLPALKGWLTTGVVRDQKSLRQDIENRQAGLTVLAKQMPSVEFEKSLKMNEELARTESQIQRSEITVAGGKAIAFLVESDDPKRIDYRIYVISKKINLVAFHGDKAPEAKAFLASVNPVLKGLVWKTATTTSSPSNKKGGL